MLGSFMEEMQITPEQFEVAVLAGKSNPGGNTLPFHQGLFQQVCLCVLITDSINCIDFFSSENRFGQQMTFEYLCA